ncbi:hypothetical protein AB0D74_26235 [Streptomyces sp. NPDC048278]|uniref:hypothetical protein n=1 Tax=Streptomyces sp. NPDC048278 TaxID=3155809 RepID=UPI0034247A08
MYGELALTAVGTGLGGYCLVRALREAGRRTWEQALGWFLASSLAFGIAAAIALSGP